ncbi:MAG: glycosyltransferase family 2 protein [Chloroflexi bacterium]|nr:glycosyltransferase family 2 protein [Chloroflexota bacterium]
MMIDGHPAPTASVIVVSYNTAAYIEDCLLSLLRLDYPEIEIIVVDNGSTDHSVELVRSHFPEVEIVELADNKGFAGGVSVGLYMASGEIVATINPDVTLAPGWMLAVARTLMQDDEIGIVGSKVLYPDGKTIQHAGGIVNYPLATTEHIGRGEIDTGQYDKARDVSFVTGAALAMRREVGRSLGFFDEAFFPVYYEDVDLCWRARDQGLRVLYQPEAVALHKESVTLDHKGRQYYGYYHANRLRFVVKHYSPEQVMLDFLPRESERVAGDMSSEDRAASFALLDNKSPSAKGAGEGEGEGDIPSGQRSRQELQGQLGEVLDGWQVYEKHHGKAQKRRPYFSGRLRTLVNRVYLWPVLLKQIDYNASVARTLREVSCQLAELHPRVALQSLLTAGLSSNHNSALVALAAELEALRARVDELEAAGHDG